MASLFYLARQNIWRFFLNFLNFRHIKISITIEQENINWKTKSKNKLIISFFDIIRVEENTFNRVYIYFDSFLLSAYHA